MKNEIELDLVTQRLQKVIDLLTEDFLNDLIEVKYCSYKKIVQTFGSVFKKYKWAKKWDINSIYYQIIIKNAIIEKLPSSGTRKLISLEEELVYGVLDQEGRNNMRGRNHINAIKKNPIKYRELFERIEKTRISEPEKIKEILAQQKLPVDRKTIKVKIKDAIEQVLSEEKKKEEENEMLYCPYQENDFLANPHPSIQDIPLIFKADDNLDLTQSPQEAFNLYRFFQQENIPDNNVTTPHQLTNQ